MSKINLVGQKDLIKELGLKSSSGRLAHSYLITGPLGSGKLSLAIKFAEKILCAKHNEEDLSFIGCQQRVKLQHPDLHFAFPVTTNDSVKKHPVSNLFLNEWRDFVSNQPYGGLFNWLQSIGVENKQGMIGVDEALEVVKKLQLKSYEGGFKVMIIWMAEKMNIAASNKLLKLIEEPPAKTIFLLITENEDQIITTIKSRCQALHFPVLSEQDIANELLIKEKCSESDALKIATQAEGNYNKAVHLLHQDSNDLIFEQWFIAWIRTAFKAKGNAAVIQELVMWSETIAKTGRETQKQFLDYCLQFFRQALLLNYKSPELVFLETQTPKFNLQNFAPFVHSE